MNLRCYVVKAQYRDTEASGVTNFLVLATTRDEAISKLRQHVRSVASTFGHRPRVFRPISARLSAVCN